MASSNPPLLTGEEAHLPTERRRRARVAALIGCAGALGYGGMKVVWALGGTAGIRDPALYGAPDQTLGPAGRWFNDWGTPVLAGLAVIVLLGLVEHWGQTSRLRPILRIAAWAGSLLAVVGILGLALILGYYLGAVSEDRLGALEPGTFVFVYLCFLLLGLSFGATAWLTREEG
jgi:hypothetical protein